MSDFTKQQFSPSNGFLNESSYPNPETGQESREQLFSLHAQTRNFINAHIDELENKDAGFDGKSSGADRIGSAEVPGLVDPDAPAAAAKTVRSQIRALLIALSSSGGNLQDQIDDETAAREAQDEALTGAIAAEADTREDADDALAAGLAAETEAREADVADITEALALKNALLIAGENITITDNGDGTQTISFSEFDLFIVAEELPAVGIENRIYLIPEEGGQSFSEHFYKDGAWEDFGTLTVDLSNYYTKTQTDSKIANSAATLAPKSHAATETTYGAASTTSYGHMRFATDAEVNTGTATDKAVTPKQLKTGLDGVITVQTVTIPASAWTAANPSTATVAVEGMTADMTQERFDVRGLSAAQAPVEASAGLGNTDIVPGNGTIKLTATGVIPTSELSLIVTIYG